MDLDRSWITRHEDRLADALQGVADGIEVERVLAGRQQEHGLVAETLVGMGHERRSTRRLAIAAHGRSDGLPADEMQERALEQPIEALAARIDDAGLAQDGQQRWRPGDRPFGLLDGRRQDGLDVRIAFGAGDGRRRGFPDDGQDGALDRLGHGRVRGHTAGRQRVGEVEPVDPLAALDRLRHAPEDLAQDDAGVPARTHQGTERDRRRDPAGVPLAFGHGLGLIERRAQRGHHVRARVPVRDGKDIEGVDGVDVGLEMCHRGGEGTEQRRAIGRSPTHAASGPASTDGASASRVVVSGSRPSSGSLPSVDGLTGVRSRSTWMASSSISRPRARRTP